MRFIIQQDQHGYGILDSKHMLYAPHCTGDKDRLRDRTSEFNRLDRADIYSWVRLDVRDVIIYLRTGKLENKDYSRNGFDIRATYENPIL
jgi:hypothetical protein